MLANPTLEKVQNALSQCTPTEISSDQILPHHKLVEDLGLDSLSVVILSIALEEEFKEFFLLHEWVVAAEDPGQLTVDSLATYVQQKLEGAG